MHYDPSCRDFQKGPYFLAHVDKLMLHPGLGRFEVARRYKVLSTADVVVTP